MKKATCIMVMAVAIVFAAACLVQASSLDDAKAMAEKAAAYVKENGKEKGVTEINNPKGKFVKGDIYVTLHDFDSTVLANPVNPKLVGMANGIGLKDASGKPFVKESIEIAKTKGGGWLTYTWTNPQTKKVQPKKAWVQRVEGTEMYTMCGLFQ